MQRVVIFCLLFTLGCGQMLKCKNFGGSRRLRRGSSSEASSSSDSSDVVLRRGSSDSSDVVLRRGSSDSSDVVLRRGSSDSSDVVLRRGSSDSSDEASSSSSESSREVDGDKLIEFITYTLRHKNSEIFSDEREDTLDEQFRREYNRVMKEAKKKLQNIHKLYTWKKKQLSRDKSSSERDRVDMLNFQAKKKGRKGFDVGVRRGVAKTLF